MARGLVGSDFEINVPEAVVSIGDVIPVAGYAMPGAKENDEIIAHALSKCDVFMMTGNGVLSVAGCVKDAFLRMELLEHLLKVDYYAKSMGTVMTLPGEDKQKLLEKRASIGLGPKTVKSPAASKESDSQPQVQTQTDLIKDLIAEELKKVLKEK
jgi:L-fuculose-phosphate aldolase